MALPVAPWVVGAVATTVMWTSYAGIAATMIKGMVKGRQWATNPLGVATVLIFVTCAASHGMHVMHALLPVVGTDLALGTAARRAFGDPRLIVWNIGAAVIAIWYLSLRNRFKVVWRGAALFDDMRERQVRALDIHDDIVQNLTEAQLALDRGERERALELIEETLEDSKYIITDILGDRDSELGFEPGEMHRLKTMEEYQ